MNECSVVPHVAPASRKHPKNYDDQDQDSPSFQRLKPSCNFSVSVDYCQSYSLTWSMWKMFLAQVFILQDPHWASVSNLSLFHSFRRWHRRSCKSIFNNLCKQASPAKVSRKSPFLRVFTCWIQITPFLCFLISKCFCANWLQFSFICVKRQLVAST